MPWDNGTWRTAGAVCGAGGEWQGEYGGIVPLNLECRGRRLSMRRRFQETGTITDVLNTADGPSIVLTDGDGERRACDGMATRVGWGQKLPCC